MSILDAVMAMVEKHPDVSPQQHSRLIQSAMEMFGSSGGLSGLMNNAHSQGLEHMVSSWIASGPNQQASADQVQKLVGQDRINQLANRVGLSSGVVSAALARILPILVDKLTPHGNLPQAA